MDPKLDANDLRISSPIGEIDIHCEVCGKVFDTKRKRRCDLARDFLEIFQVTDKTQ